MCAKTTRDATGFLPLAAPPPIGYLPEVGTFDVYREFPLHGGCLLVSVRGVQEPITDALGRPALARTAIIGLSLVIELSISLSAEEISVILYHEILEAVSVASAHPPPAVRELNEANFEAAAWRMHAELGPVSPATLNRMLELFGF